MGLHGAGGVAAIAPARSLRGGGHCACTELEGWRPLRLHGAGAAIAPARSWGGHCASTELEGWRPLARRTGWRGGGHCACWDSRRPQLFPLPSPTREQPSTRGKIGEAGLVPMMGAVWLGQLNVGGPVTQLAIKEGLASAVTAGRLLVHFQAYEWMCPTGLQALTHWVLAAGHRPAGHFQESSEHLELALRAVDGGLQSLGLLKGDIQEMTVMGAHSWLSLGLLKTNILEGMCSSSLTEMKLDRFQQAMQLLIAHIETWKEVNRVGAKRGDGGVSGGSDGELRSCPGSSIVHLLLGLYSQTLQLHAETQRHLILASECTPPAPLPSPVAVLDPAHMGTGRSRLLALLHLTLAYLGLATPEARSKAQDTITAINRHVEEEPGQGAAEEAAVLMVAGLAKGAAGDSVAARSKATEALKLAHRTLGNIQMVAQCLCIIANINCVSGGTRQEVEAHLNNARILARNVHGDLPTQIKVLLAPTLAHLGILRRAKLRPERISGFLAAPSSDPRASRDSS
ncbi:histidinol-phosphate aminotransferase, partial [Cymbomonas tetramitiformis]